MSDSQPRKRLTPLTSADFSPGVWSTPATIRFGHCDPAGIVFTPRYFDILHTAIEEFFGGALELDYYAMAHKRRLGLGYGHAGCDFFKTNSMGDRLDIAVTVAHIGQSSYSLDLHAMKNGEETLRGRFVTVPTSMETWRPIPIPHDIREALAAYRARGGAAPA